MSADPPAVVVVVVFGSTSEWREGDRAQLLCSASGGRPADFNYAFKCATDVQSQATLSHLSSCCPVTLSSRSLVSMSIDANGALDCSIHSIRALDKALSFKALWSLHKVDTRQSIGFQSRLVFETGGPAGSRVRPLPSPTF